MIPPDLKNICDTIGIHPNKQDKLAACNISSVDNLVRNYQKLKERKLRGFMIHEQDVLYHFVCWFKEFEFSRKNFPDCNENGDFNLEAFEKFSEDKERIKTVEDLMLYLQDEQNFGENMFMMYLNGDKSFYRILEDSDKKEALLEHISDLVQQNLSESLRKSQLFELDFVVTKTAESILSQGKCPPRLVYGPTQSGKTAYKAVVLATCLIMKVPVIIITKDKPESLALYQKFKEHAFNTAFEGKIFTPYSGRQAAADIQHQISIDNGIAIVLPDIASRIDLGFQILERHQEKQQLEGKDFKFGLIVDEADAMLRTKSKKQKMEQAMTRLINLKPCLHVMVTATPQPIMLYYKNEVKEELDIEKLNTDIDYGGLDNMQLLQDVNGEPVYLDTLKCHDNENIRLNTAPIYNEDLEPLFDGDQKFDKRSGFPCDNKVGTIIPFTNEKIKSMYDLALFDNRKGTLVLDCSARKVWVPGNIFEKAALIQELYAGIGKQIVIIVNIGRGLCYRLPGQKNGYLCDPLRNVKVHDIISCIDNSSQYGYGTPIFIFGYTKMRRVISYRSQLRVPTHIVMYLSPGFSVENLIQALGRATFNGKSILIQNGRSHVIYLTTRGDSQVGLPHNRNIGEVIKRKRMGETLAAAMDGNGIFGLLPSNTNYLCYTNRKTGQRKKSEEFGMYMNRRAYKSRPMVLEEHEESLKDKHFEDPDSQAVLYILCDDRNTKENEHGICANDIKDIFATRFLDGDEKKLRGRFSRTNVTQTINALSRDGLVHKMQSGAQLTQRRDCIWAEVVDTARTSRLFLNHQLLKDKERLILLIEQKREKTKEEKSKRSRKRKL